MNKLYRNKEWLFEQYINKKKSMSDIAKICNVSSSTIRKWLIKFDIKIRTYSEASKGKKHSEETKRKIGDAIKGYKHSRESKKKMSNNKKGKKHYRWNDKNPSKRAIHKWVDRNKQKKKICIICNRNNIKTYWGNINHKYKRRLDDYFEVCIHCHRLYDALMFFGWNIKDRFLICKKITTLNKDGLIE